MFFPRLITLLLALACAAAATYLRKEASEAVAVFTAIGYVVAAFFSISAVVMFIGLFGLERTEMGVVIKRNGVLSKMMRLIIEDDKGLHCCDIYLRTTGLLALLCFLVLITGMFLFGVYAFFTDWRVVVFATLITSTSYVLIYGFAWLYDYIKKHLSARTWRIIGFTLVGLAGVAILGSGGFELFETYGLEKAVLIGLACAAVAGVPGICLGGKKLLQRHGGRFATRVCPVIHP